MDNLLNLEQLFNKKIFRIPDYQRGYSWQNKQLEEFWDDVLSLLPNQNHYTGMLSLKEVSEEEISSNLGNWKNEQWLRKSYTIDEIVDGQQRLTTLIILINEIVKYCEEHGITTLNGCDKLEDIRAKFLFKESEIIRTYIFGYEVDNPSYEYFKIKILEDPNKAAVEETFYTLNLSNAKEFFRNKLKDLIPEKVEEIYLKITVRLKFNIYNIKDDFNVYVAFETMNNRGKKLSCLELLKNRLIYLSTLFDRTEDEKNTVREEINKTWRDVYKYLGKDKNHPLNDDVFLQHHWMIYFGYQTRKLQNNKTIPFDEFLLNKHFIQQNIDRQDLVKANNEDNLVGDEIIQDDIEYETESDEGYMSDDEIYYETRKEPKDSLTLVSIQRYIKSLRQLIPYWYQTYEPSSVENSDISKYLFRLNILGFVNARPLVTVLLSREDISEEDKVKCLRLIERFNFLHYRLNNYAATYDNAVFYNLARDLYYGRINIDDVLSVVGKIESYYMSSNNVIKSEGPIDKFSKLMKRDGWYSWGTALRYLLYIYDLDKSNGEISRQKINPDKYFGQDAKDQCSIEHIYPQTPNNEYWVSRFGEYSDYERKCLVGSLGNLLPLSLEINKSLQNDSFDDKKNGTEDRKRGYINGSCSEMEVAKNDEWTPKHILERGMEILSFMEKEFDFKFPNDFYRKRLLGLEFMAEKDDKEKNKTEPIDYEEETKEKEFNEETFRRLSGSASNELMDMYNKIYDYCLTISGTVKIYTTSNYVAFIDRQAFVELHFQKDCLKLLLYSGNYNDPERRIEKLNEKYLWVLGTALKCYPGDDFEYIKSIIKQSYEFSHNK